MILSKLISLGLAIGSVIIYNVIQKVFGVTGYYMGRKTREFYDNIKK